MASNQTSTMSTSATNKSLLQFFSRSLTSFRSSGASFQILCTLLPHSNSSSSHHEPQPHPPSDPVPHLTIMDSSFNPPTAAHRDMVLSTPSASRILLLLSVQNADKAPQPASFELRLCMMEALAREILESQSRNKLGGGGAAAAAAAAGSTTVVDLAVTTRPYFHDKATAVRTSPFYGEGGGLGDITFLAGFDTLVRVLNPKYYGGEEGMEEALGPFFEKARLRVTMRPGEEWGSREEQEKYLRELGAEGRRGPWRQRIQMVNGSGQGVGVSSSGVRELIADGKTVEVKNLVGENVKNWIIEEDLYKEE